MLRWIGARYVAARGSRGTVTALESLPGRKAVGTQNAQYANLRRDSVLCERGPADRWSVGVGNPTSTRPVTSTHQQFLRRFLHCVKVTGFSVGKTKKSDEPFAAVARLGDTRPVDASTGHFRGAALQCRSYGHGS